MVTGFRYARGVSRGVRRGNTFIPEGRLPAREAPGGSTASPIRSFRLDEKWDFQITTHRFPVRGLPAPIRILQIGRAHV